MLTKKNSISKLFVLLSFIAIVYLTVQSNSGTTYAQGSFLGSTPYTVKSGDSLYLIAARNNVSLDILKVVNGLTSDIISPGQVLNIPTHTGFIFSRYTVVSGDSLYIIALKYGVTVDNIKAANNISTNTILPDQVLTIPRFQQKPLSTILQNKNIKPSQGNIDLIVDKSDHTLLLFSKGTWLKTYHIEIGSGGLADKQVRGDKKTPEGAFYVCEESILNPADQYLGTRWMRLSYPNTEDALRSLNSGLINWNTYSAIKSAINNGSIPPQNTPLGAGVGIHGGNSPTAGIDWTWGCIGLTSRDVEEIFDYIGVGTHVYIER